MAVDHASRARVAALTAASPGSPPPPERPDPEFWGAEPRRVRRTRRAEPCPEPAAPPWWSALVDRVRDGRLELGIGAVAVVLVALVAGVVWYRMAVDGAAAPAVRPADAAPPARVDRGAPSGLPAGATVASATTAPAAARRGDAVVVHVAGAVTHPGVLLMPVGARVIDAIEGAGGATPTADLDRLNLAAKLVDGQRILVVEVGATPAVAPEGAAVPSADPGALIDLNAATRAQLESLPGIGPTLAAAILAERDRRGGFRSVNELREVRGIGEARFADLRARVTV